MRNISLILFAILIYCSHAQFLEWSNRIFDVIEQPFVQTENFVVDVDARMYEMADDTTQHHDADLRQLEQMIQRDEEKFIETFIKPQQHTSLHSNPIEKSPLEFDDVSGRYAQLDDSVVMIEFEKNINEDQLRELFDYLREVESMPHGAINDISISKNIALLRVDKRTCDPTHLVNTILKHMLRLMQEKHIHILSADLALKSNRLRINEKSKDSYGLLTDDQSSGVSIALLVALIVTPVVFSVLLGVAICMLRRRRVFMRRQDDEERLLKPDMDMEDKAARVSKRAALNKVLRPSTWMKIVKRSPGDETKRGKDISPTEDYQDLCRQRMESNTDKCSPISSSLCATSISNINTPGLSGINSSTINSTPIRITNETKSSDSDRNSSWSDESSKSFSIDIKTGHALLKFMERHLMDKNLLNDEWKTLCKYEAEPNKCDVARLEENRAKNRYQDSVPYDHSRVKLKDNNNNNDYINASYIIDDDPKNATYIVTQSPLTDTIRDFWSMVWQTESSTIVTLCNSDEYDSRMCPTFWPDSSLQVYGIFEIHLVSVHIWCEDYLIRNFLVKNIECNQSRAITQFHYLVWPTSGVPSPIKSILEFRRKVKKSRSNHSSPTIVHCNNGIGRTGAYLLVDMIINKVIKGAKEIDLAATLEYLRDQRANIVNKKNLYEFAFEAITEELKQLLE